MNIDYIIYRFSFATAMFFSYVVMTWQNIWPNNWIMISVMFFTIGALMKALAAYYTFNKEHPNGSNST